MSSFETSLHVAAPPQVVWDILVDVGRWPEWTPTVRRVERLDSGPFGMESRARLRLRGVMFATEWRVTDFQPGQAFTWQSRVMPSATSIGVHEVRPDGDGSWVTLRIAYGGPLAVVLSPLLASPSRQNLADEIGGLKRAAEQRAATGA